MIKKLLLLFSLVLIACAGVWAQGSTTATISGRIAGVKAGSGPDAKSGKEFLPGATVVALHTPTGTEQGTASKSDGYYTLTNLRVGGPYKITVSFVGYKAQTFDNIFLKLSEPFTLDISLQEEGTQLSEVVVTAQPEDEIMNSNRNGAATNITSRQFLTMPTIARNLNDMLRFTPQASSSIVGAMGGGSYRQNNITVDGADFNNTFGIGTNLPAGGAPISLDAIQEMTVSITPFDVKQANFIGSAQNVVTRSGTNEFSGSAYTFFRNQNQQGNKVSDNNAFTRQPLDIKTYGFRLGGPIIKNKLFFFASYETTSETRPGQTNFASTPTDPYGSAPNIARPSASFLDTVTNYLQSKYGYATGPYQDYSFISKNTKMLGRIDWNINQNHRLTIRYSQVESRTPNFPSTSRSPMGAYPNSRTSIYALPFKNANYYQDGNFYSFAAELNSSLFGGKFANTLRFTSTHQNDPRSSDSAPFPFVDILDGTGTPAVYGNPLTSFGYELFTGGNLRDVQSYSVVDYLTWSTGKHNWTAGLQFDLQATKNGFQRFATSYYTFRNWNDFISGASAQDFALTYSLQPGYAQAFPRFKFGEYSVYGQDEINISDKFKLTAGLRLDLPTYLKVDEIQTHPLVAQLTFAGGQTIDTGVLPKNQLMWSPRVGFNWDVKGDRTIQVRGGSGIFTGRIPTVWIVSQSGDAGLLQVTQTWHNISATAPGPNGATSVPFNPDPNAYRPTTQPIPGAVIPSSISAMDQSLKFPQTWKTSVALDQKLPYGIVGTVEAIFNKDLNVNYGRNPNLVDPQNLNVSGYADNRLIYPNPVSQKFINPLNAAGQAAPGTGTVAFNPIVLGNASKGYYFSATAKLDKQFSNGLAAMAAYTFTTQKNLYDGIGDQLINTWSGTQMVGNPNNLSLAYSGNVVPSRVIASVSYRREYLGHLATSIALFYEGSTYGRYSYIYSGDFNRDGQTNDLIYIPKNASEITFVPQGSFTAQQQSDAFFAYIAQDKYLSKHQGEYAQRNGAQYPWRSQFDLRFAQDIFATTGKYKQVLQFTVDIFNFANLLNPHWGIKKIVNTPSILKPTNTGALTPGGTTVPTFQLATVSGNLITSTYRDDNSINSTYYMQFGLRYSF